jgi:hypothetical protein
MCFQIKPFQPEPRDMYFYFIQHRILHQTVIISTEHQHSQTTRMLIILDTDIFCELVAVMKGTKHQ